jgi:hypothetical protein
LVEGFLNDLRSGHKPDRTRTGTRQETKSAVSERKSSTKDRKTAAAASQAASSTRSASKTSAASLGRLNAAHASAQAMQNAAPNSTVGRINSYKTALEDGKLDDAAEALAGVSNKAVTAEAVRSLNDLLGITVKDPEVTEIVEKVEALQEKQKVANGTTVSTAVTASLTTPAATSTGAPLGRLNAAHASPQAMQRAASNSPVAQIGAYKAAIADGDLDAAAAALAKASNKTVTETTVRNLNGLLDTTLTDEEVTDLVEKTEALKAEASVKASKKTSSFTR